MASTILFTLAGVLAKLFTSVQIPSCSSSDPRKLSATATEFSEMKDILRRIRAVLADADRREIEDLHVKMWLYDLRQVAYDLEDIVDELSYKTVQDEAEMNTDEHAVKRKFQVLDTVNSPVNEHDKSLDSDMVDKISKVRNRLNSIISFRESLSLREGDGQIRARASNMRASSSLASETGIVGRDEEKSKLLHDLLNDDNGTDNNLQVFSIVAMGGMGKTTLAKLVYNDEQVKDHFHIRAWAWISQAYDVARITKAIIESIQGEACGLTELDALQNRLRHIVSGKRFLIVLDDIWNENSLQWDSLRLPLDRGGRGSRIVATTRNQNVAQIMSRRMPQINLNGLNPTASWALFYHCIAQGCPSSVRLSETLETIGRGIVEKCSGVPLTIRVIGGLLSSETDEETWNDILASDIWNLTQGRDWVLDILKVSYVHLPVEIKPCFLYCSLFPRGYMFDKENVVRMWAAHGYLQVAQSGRMESLGHKYISELVGRSFFQQQHARGLGCYFTLHDLIHDLAKSLVRDQSQQQELQDLPNITSPRLDIIRSQYDRHFSAFLSAKALETPIIVQSSRGQNQESLRSVLLCLDGGNDDFLQVHSGGYSVVVHFERDFFMNPHVRFLRVLELGSCRLSELPHTIGNMKQLRYLGLSCTDIVRLPQAVCSLFNLQTLDLRCCRFLVELPKDIGKLQNLRHLDYNILGKNDSAIPICKFKSIPEGIGKLTKLQTLPVFIVHFNGQTAGVAELKNLNNLQGPLRISSLEHITWERTCEARVADLITKVHIRRLCLQWNSHIRYGDNPKSQVRSSQEIDLEVLDSLEPHNRIQWIEIEKYMGCSYPKWVGHPSFQQLETVIIRDFSSDSLPPLGQLPYLRHLEVREMSWVRTIGSEFYGEEVALQRFPALQTLLFDEMTVWNDWLHDEGQHGFPCLQELTISNCLCLKSLSLYNMAALKRLTVKGCHDLVVIKGLEECWVSTKHSQNNYTDTPGYSRFVDGNGPKIPNSTLPARLEVIRISDCTSLPNSSLQQAIEITRIFRRRSNSDIFYSEQKEVDEGAVLII